MKARISWIFPDLLAINNPANAQGKPAEFIESGRLAEIDRSGRIDRLYAGQK